MSKVKIQGNASGTGVVTLTAPNTNTDRTITLPDETVSLTGAPAGLDDVGGVARATSGLLFNADTAAANALDDYEEGTWTPAWLAGTSDATYTVQVGTYTKIGNKVHIQGQMAISALGTMSGVLSITGLPFASNGTAGNIGGLQGAWASGLAITAGTNISGYVVVGNTTIRMEMWSAAGGTSDFQATNLSSNGALTFQASYTV